MVCPAAVQLEPRVTLCNIFTVKLLKAQIIENFFCLGEVQNESLLRSTKHIVI